MPLVGMGENAIREWLLDNATHPEARDAIGFLERTGRFTDIDRSEPGREQVFPAMPPPVEAQTHTGGYQDGA